tara:strand:+ start:25969 stop:26217 length:249 start_codon:yes stop_codon:yes gene_type:complete
MRPPRRTGSAIDQAEAAFKAATSKPAEAPAKATSVPEGREMVTLRLDRAVLEHFQDDGPGWQDRINDALRIAAGLDGAGSLP